MSDSSLAPVQRNRRYRYARSISRVVRFRTLPKAEKLYRQSASPMVLKRKLFTFDCYLDVSRSLLHNLLYLDGESVIGERNMLKRLVRPGMCVVDVGANIGYYLLMFEKYLRGSGTVVCIEPSPENLVELKRNIRGNGFNNVVLHENASGSRKDVVSIKGGINSGVVTKGEGIYQAAICRLDEQVTQKVDFLKIDVDGYEGQVLEGAEGIMRRYKPVLFLEYHPLLVGQHGYSLKKTYEIISKYYKDISIYDVPEEMNILQKVRIRYLGSDPVRRLGDDGQSVEDSHIGHQYGTFWIVCR
jgi:FkbM family methyltransferase